MSTLHEGSRPITLRIESVPESEPPKEVLGFPATQAKIDHEIFMQGRGEKVIFPGVWAIQTNETTPTGDPRIGLYFTPTTQVAMNRALLERFYPRSSSKPDQIRNSTSSR